MRRHILWLLSLILVSSVLLSACAPAPAAQPVQATAPAAAEQADAPAAGFDWQMRKGETLRVAMVKQPWSEFVEKYIAEFETLTGIDVTYEILPEDQFRQKTTVEFAAGTSDVDVFLSMVAQEGIKYETAGWYQDIEELVNNAAITDPEFDFADFTSSGLSIAKLSNGKLIGLPVYNEFGALMYNKALFEKANVPYPPKTLEEMEQAAAAITDKEQGIYGFVGRGKGAAATSQFSSVMYSMGAGWTTEDGKAALTDPTFLEAVKWYGDMLRNYGPDGSTSYTWQQAQDQIIQGKAGMWLDASVFFANLVDPAQSTIADSAGIAMVPAGAAGQVPYVGGWHLSIYNQSKHKDAAWLFMQWALGKDMVLKAQLANITTSRVSAWESPEYKAANKHTDLSENFLKAMGQGNAQWNPPVLGVSEARDEIGVVIVTAIEGGDVDAAAAKANELLQGLLDDTPQLEAAK